ncbi:MAG: DUF5713 family protein [Nannocystaceae bacterium]
MPIADPTLRAHTFLAEMIADSYFPRALIADGQRILVELCEAIERERPADGEGIYALTRAATERFNELCDVYEEIETAAREAIAGDFDRILRTYGYAIDLEEAISDRDW